MMSRPILICAWSLGLLIAPNVAAFSLARDSVFALASRVSVGRSAQRNVILPFAYPTFSVTSDSKKATILESYHFHRILHRACFGLSLYCGDSRQVSRSPDVALGRGGHGDESTGRQATPRYFDTVDDLRKWEMTVDILRAKPLGRSFPGLPQRRRVIHCHDYAGGFHKSADEDYLATFSSWAHFDLFIYFSHHRVVVPPHIWQVFCACSCVGKCVPGWFDLEVAWVWVQHMRVGK